MSSSKNLVISLLMLGYTVSTPCEILFHFIYISMHFFYRRALLFFQSFFDYSHLYKRLLEFSNGFEFSMN